MQCDICLRSSSNRLPFHCASCARDVIYEQRILLAQTLLDSEAAGKAVESSIAVGPTGDQSKASTQFSEPSLAWAHKQAIAEGSASMKRTEGIMSHVDALRKETERTRSDIAKRKAGNVKRWSDLKSTTLAAQREAEALESVKKGVERMERRWDMLHTRTMESRVFLCREAAQLYGLQQRIRKKAGSVRDIYMIGGVPIPDLRDLNNASPAHVTTSNTNLAHLLHLVSHYLGIRLPAEITLSHQDYPLPTIFPPASSYISHEVPFPGSTPSHSSNNSPSASRIATQRWLPRPRPLYLDRKLSLLHKEDPAAYNSFVEGITYLAWNIAWICKTQGMQIGNSNWEDICPIGKNLWRLLVLPQPRQPNQSPSPATVPRNISRNDSHAKSATSLMPTQTSPYSPAGPEPQSARLGHLSHATAHSFLESAEGTARLQSWRLQDSQRLIEHVRMMLSHERAGADWEILEDKEWEEEGADADNNGKDNEGLSNAQEERGKGTNLWPRILSRGGS